MNTNFSTKYLIRVKYVQIWLVELQKSKSLTDMEENLLGNPGSLIDLERLWKLFLPMIVYNIIYFFQKLTILKIIIWIRFTQKHLYYRVFISSGKIGVEELYYQLTLWIFFKAKSREISLELHLESSLKVDIKTLWFLNK